MAAYATLDTDPDGRAALAARAYLAVLGRAADGPGLADAVAFLDAGGSPGALAARLAASPEFASGIGRLDDQGFLGGAFAAVLGRAPGADDLSFYGGQLAGGRARAAVAADLARSAEAREHVASLYPEGIAVPDPVAQEIAQFYDAAFDRVPDASEIAFWRAELADGLGRDGLADAFAGSAEFAARHAGQGPAALVAGLYADALGRAPSAAELDFYAARVAEGLTPGALLSAFALSSEQAAGFEAGRGFEASANRAPTARAQSAVATEDAGLPATGSLLAGATDPDPGDALRVVEVAGDTAGVVPGRYGTLRWDAASGAYDYRVDDALAVTDALGVGRGAIDDFRFTVADAYGATSVAVLAVTVAGANDAPRAELQLAGVLDTGTAGGSLLGGASDVDAGAVLRVLSVSGDATGSVAGEHGTLLWDTGGGAFTYRPSGVLPAAGVATDSFAVRLADEYGAEVVRPLEIAVIDADASPLLAGTLDGGQSSLAAFVLLAEAVSILPGLADPLFRDAVLANSGATPAWIAFDPAAGSFVATPGDDTTGLYRLLETALDDAGLSFEQFLVRLVENTAPAGSGGF